MLCALLCLSKNMEGILYDVIDSRMKDKKKEYEKIPLQTTEQIYGALEANIPDRYQFNENTTVFVMNCISEDCTRMKLTPEIIESVNNAHPLTKGVFLYSMYKEQEQ